MKKLWQITKNYKFLIILGVFTLTILTIGASYSSFFAVKSNTSNQTVTTGTLEVTYTEGSTSINKEENMQRMTDEEGLAQSEASFIYLRNNGTLPVDYVLTVGYDTANYEKRQNKQSTDILTPYEYIKIAVYEYNGVNQEDTLILGPKTLADLTVYKADLEKTNETRYSILVGQIAAQSDATKTYKIKMWLSTDATPYASNSYFYVNSQIVAEPSDTKVAYNIDGILKNNDDSKISNATINIQNNSIITTTDENGHFTLNNILPGTYNLDITANNQEYSTTITVKKSDETSISPNVTNYTAKTGDKLPNVAYINSTTINKLREANNIIDTSATFAFENKEYIIPKNYVIFGSATSDIGTMNITLNEKAIEDISLS